MTLHDSIKGKEKNLPLVSVIMPIYNTQDFLAVAINSVLNQSYENFELICVDDGSTDSSAEIVRSYMAKDNRISFTQIENHGQGYVRNMAVKTAKGEYIQFLDADDFIEPLTLELAVTRAEKDKSDLVIYDWYYFKPLGMSASYINSDALYSRPVLEGEECLELLNISPFFTVNKLYRKSFLLENNVVYGEDYIYEDIPFWVKAALNATRVSTIHSPLYRVTINNSSTTKTDLGTDKHCRGFILAVEEIARDFQKKPATNEARYAVFLYLIQKFGFYYVVRTPKELKRSFIHDFVDAISKIPVEDLGRDKYLTSYIKANIFRKKRYAKFSRLIHFYYVRKPKLKKIYDKCVSKAKGIARRLRRLLPKHKKAPTSRYSVYTKQPLYNDVILFIGFDYRYTGNSRYLFEEIIKIPSDKKIFFVTDDVRVPLQYRIAPHTDRANRFIARAKTVIFESWIPTAFVKRQNANWIQLWHGTPLKKMLFDSNEKSIIERNPQQKISKFKDIQRWTYFLTDTPEIDSYFRTSFLLPEHKFIHYGYPRVKYLIEHRNNEHYKNTLKDNYGFPKDKKLVLYLPTWRDYNYRAEEGDYDISYLLDPAALQEKLGEDYLVVYKDHAFLSKSELISYKNHDTAETQELLVMADFLVSDYSSVIFDAFAVDIPVALYCRDLDRNNEERGVYDGMWQDISPLLCHDVDEIVESVKNYRHAATISALREKYGYKATEASSFTEFLINL